MRSHWAMYKKHDCFNFRRRMALPHPGAGLCQRLGRRRCNCRKIIHADIIFLNVFKRPEVIFAEVFLPFGCPESGFNLVEGSAS